MKAMIASVFPMFCSECSAPLKVDAMPTSAPPSPFPTHVIVICRNKDCKEFDLDFRMPLPSIDCKRV